jgi:multimeric flavodoxin WrbA
MMPKVKDGNSDGGDRMKILGIVGSARKEATSGTHALVAEVLENTGVDYDLISLRGKQISGCIACLGCAPDNICKVKDDMADLRQQIVAADAYVIGAPNYYSTLNAVTHAFLERWFQFRHQEGNALWGKLGVAVGVGGMKGQPPALEIEKFFLYNFIETVAKVTGQGAASCYACGYGETCSVGVPRMVYGENVRIAPEMIPDVRQDETAMTAAAAAGKQLGARLTTDHDREFIAQKMQENMMALLKSSA